MALQQITIGIPDKVPLAAVKLFESGSLSFGRAAELANISRVEFLLNLNRFKVFPLASELDASLRRNMTEAVSNTSPLLETKAGMWISAKVRQRILVLAGEG